MRRLITALAGAALAMAISTAQAAAPSAAGMPARTTCDWSAPGAQAYTGDVPAAVDAYTDIPASVRATLKRRMAARQYDEVATITRTEIIGRTQYSGEIRDMHWRGGLCRGVVSRTGWPAGATERGLVYCEDGHCILVPTVCRNVSRITRLEPGTPRQAQPRPADDGPIDITPSAGGWGAQPDHPGTGPGLRLPAWAPPVELGPVAAPAGPLLAGTSADGGADSPAMPTAWMERLLPTLLPEPGPVLLPAPTPPVPEPAGWALMALGAAAVFLTARNRPERSHP